MWNMISDTISFLSVTCSGGAISCLSLCARAPVFLDICKKKIGLIFKTRFVHRGLFCTYNKNVGEENWKCFCFQQSNQRREKLDKQSLLNYLMFILHLKEKKKYSVFFPEEDNLFYLLIDKILGRNN